jgi:hypothetical protein
MVKKKIFVGSSSEEIKLAELAKSLLENELDVTIWNEKLWDSCVFKINENFLSDLLKASLKFDFGILLGTNDDKVIFRGEEKLQPRDNILFELGLFTGRLGTSKCAFVIDKEIKIPSDLSGLTLSRFDKNDMESFKNAINQIKEFFLKGSEDDINFFPSSTLAAVYYENFIIPICRFIIEKNGFETKKHAYKKCKIKIIIPNQINDDVNLQFEKIKTKFKIDNETFKYAGRSRNIIIDTQIVDDTLEFIDFPTILTGINHSIENLLPSEFRNSNDDYKVILERELRRFITTLKRLLINGGFDEMVNVIRESEL